MRQRPAHRNLAIVQKHEIDVAVRIQFPAAITANGHQREWRKLLLRLRGQTTPCRFPKVLQQRVEHCRPCLADFESVPTAAMFQFEPVRLDFEEAFVTCELFRRVAGRFQRQTLFGVILDFFQQTLHGCTVTAVCGYRNYFDARRTCYTKPCRGRSVY